MGRSNGIIVQEQNCNIVHFNVGLIAEWLSGMMLTFYVSSLPKLILMLCKLVCL